MGFGSVFALALALPISSPILFPASDWASSALWSSHRRALPSATLARSSYLSPKGWQCSRCSCEGEEKSPVTSHPAVPPQRWQCWLRRPTLKVSSLVQKLRSCWAVFMPIPTSLWSQVCIFKVIGKSCGTSYVQEPFFKTFKNTVLKDYSYHRILAVFPHVVPYIPEPVHPSYLPLHPPLLPPCH